MQADFSILIYNLTLRNSSILQIIYGVGGGYTSMYTHSKEKIKDDMCVIDRLPQRQCINIMFYAYINSFQHENLLWCGSHGWFDCEWAVKSAQILTSDAIQPFSHLKISEGNS